MTQRDGTRGRGAGTGPDAAPLPPLAALLPDLPRWVEARALLLHGGDSVQVAATSGPAGVVWDPEDRLAAVVGEPPDALIRQAASDADEVLVPPESVAAVAAALPGWKQEEAILHTLAGAAPAPPDRGVRWLGSHEIGSIQGLSADLRQELDDAAADGSPIAAAFADAVPVAFCYPGSITETLWDVSIDTLPPYRRQGHAARCASFVIASMETRGRRPVWGALRSNAASLGLAARLGFAPVDGLFVFSRAAADGIG